MKLIVSNIAENIIVYLIEKYPKYFKKLDFNLYIYADLEKYYKNNAEKIEQIKINNEEVIKKFIQNTHNDIEQQKNKLLKDEYIKKYFKIPNKSSTLFDCLFDSNFKPLIELKKDDKANDNVEKIFENYNEKITQLEKIHKELKENINIKIKIKSPESLTNNPKLEAFFNRLDELLKNNEKIIPFLDKLNNYEYETCITGESYTFFSKCLEHIITKILPEIIKKKEAYEKDKNEFENSINEKEKIIYFLNNLNKKSDSFFAFNEDIIDVEELNEYMNIDNNNAEKKDADLKEIRNILGILVNKEVEIDWSDSNKCKLSTLLFLKQNNY